MVAKQRPAISDTELEVLKTIWDQGPGTVREINHLLRRQGRKWAYTTVLTLLQRLEVKGYVTSDKTAVAHVFRPAVSRATHLRQRLKDLANQLCEGMPAPLLLALVEGHRYSPDEISHFRQLLDQLEGKKGKETK